MAGVSAEKARQKAEARRLRILARGAERLDVVSGLAPTPKSSSTATTTTLDDPSNAAAAAAVVSPESTTTSSPDKDGSSSSNNAAAAADAAPVEVAETAERRGDSNSKGARRMAAMRKRRYQSKSKAKEAVESGGDDGAKGEEKVEVKNNYAVVAEVVKKDDAAAAAAAVESSEPAVSVEIKAPSTEADNKDEEEKENQPTPAVAATATTTTTTPIEEKKEEEDAGGGKKYMGVARMRRKILKEQKAQRLKDIADAEVMGTPNRHRSDGTDLERELAAEMATMDVTASMVRKGGMVVDDSKAHNLSSMALMKTKLKKRWWSAFVPPMKLVPRMVTLLLLFFAGLDLGMQPHYKSGVGSSSPFSGDLAARDLVGSGSGGGGGIGFIHHVEPSLTKPWEYGMGGKVAYMVGMAPSSPPTSLPTSFDGDMACIAAGDYDDATGECLATTSKSTTGGKGDKKKKSKEDKKKINKVQLAMEDEFDSSRTRPRGAVAHDDEFADTTTPDNKSNNIDPLFQVDLDSLLTNAQLPFPIHYAAKIAIGFHRTWVYYLWTLPTSLVKWIMNIPKNFLSGWISNPPWILVVTLMIRLVTRLLAGNGKSPFSLDPEKDDSGSGKSDILGGGGKNLDVMGKVMETAKGYMTSKFPRTALVFGTMMKVMKVEMYVVLLEMYVVLCGWLMGLVREDIILALWSGSSASGDGGGRGGSVLGDGEL
ncbi:hypothetical protein ACHAXR_010867 [Thalassiosira sp. AJA248-18]